MMGVLGVGGGEEGGRKEKGISCRKLKYVSIWRGGD
jgi:hypothetical protein